MMDVKPQPDPKPTDGTPVWDLVIADMRERDNDGRRKYGTPLQANNGRDALVDAYQEALDLAVYLKQAIVERGKVKVAPCQETCFPIETQAAGWRILHGSTCPNAPEPCRHCGGRTHVDDIGRVCGRCGIGFAAPGSECVAL